MVSLRGEAKEKSFLGRFYDVGVIGKISRLIKLPDNAVQVLILGLVKFRIKEWIRWEPYPVAKIEVIKEEEVHSDEIEALIRNVVSLFQQVVELAPYLPREAFVTALNIKRPSRLANFIASNLNLDVESKMELLAAPDLSTKLTRLSFYLTRELEILQIGSRIQSQVQQEMAKTQREYFLREQLKAIQQELGELDEKSLEIKELREKLESLDLPPEVRKEAEKEIERLSRLSPNSFEYPIIRNYLDWIIELPWNVSTEDNLDIDLAKNIR